MPPQKIEIQLTSEDAAAVEDLLEESPFSRNAVLRAALRIGIQAIQGDPSVLLPYVGKQLG